MTRSTKFMLASLGTLCLLASTPAMAQEPAPMTPMIEKSLTIIATGEAEAQTMALTLANQMQMKGTQINALLCGPAGDLALATPTDASLQITTPKGGSPRKLLEMLMSNGGTVQVCAIYLPNRKLGVDALLDGVTAARPQDISADMMNPEIRVFTW